ncbi:MAG: FkbM family methyltransferase [Maritimibacter sp.]
MSGTVDMPITNETGADYFDLAAAQDSIESGAPFAFPPFEVVRTRMGATNVTFCVNMVKDAIQNCHRKGEFYEQPELNALAAALPHGLSMLDVGANVGNHALFFALFKSARRVVVIEPNPLAIAPLVGNVMLNGLNDVIDISALGIGLSDRSEGGFGMNRRAINLGGTPMRPNEGTIEAHAGDDLFQDEAFDFIKIDVEGMEMKVLSGLEKTVSTHRPLMFVEVENDHIDAFMSWVEKMNYSVQNEWQRYENNKNYLIAPNTADGTEGAG